MRISSPAALLRLVVVVVPALVVATFAVWFLQDEVGVPNPSAVYLVAVVLAALVGGTSGAIIAAVGSFVIYDYLFTAPRQTFSIADPGVWVSVVLLLFVAVVVGQLVALERSRRAVAQLREQEAQAMFRLSHALATRDSTPLVLPRIAQMLQRDADSERVQIGIGDDDAGERIATDTSDQPRPPATSYEVLRRMPEEQPSEWVRVHPPGGRPRGERHLAAFRVRIEAQGKRFGSIWALRAPAAGPPDGTQTRLLAATADQLGQVLAHDRLAAESQAAEIARQSDELKSALLQSVSHDLRTPLATIRAAAGGLRPSGGLSPAEQNDSIDAIDREVEYLNRLVTNLLDMSRIEAGALRSECDVFELDDLVDRLLQRLRTRLGQRHLELAINAPPVDVDPTFFDGAVTNIIENTIKYTPADATVRISAYSLPDGLVRVTIEDSGPGVPADALPRLFDKFYRVPGTRRSSRAGTGIGLAVVRGLVEAMGGRVAARRSELGGLAVDLDLASAQMPRSAGAAPSPSIA